jgi:hypothetical protein
VSSDDYFLEIEAHFAMRRGTPFILSAKDWTLMQRWRAESIPLPVVIEAIDSVFEKNETSGRRKVISSLSYCKHAVKEMWDARRDLYAGGSEVAPEVDPQARLESLAQRIELSRAGGGLASRVRALASERSVPRIEQRLMEIEREWINSMIASAPREIERMRTEITASLGDTSKLDAKTRARTEEANLRRLIRERFDLPRLTLFG